MLEHDHSGFIKFLKEFPDHPKKAKKIADTATLSVDANGIDQLILAGMGGSAISGELIGGYLREELSVPVTVHRSYGLPNHVTDKSLVMVLSYSGNTEETISAMEAAIKRKSRIIALSTGGTVKELCDAHSISYVPLPTGYPPRQALGYIFFILLNLMERLELASSQKSQIKETTTLLREELEQYNPETTFGNNLANHIAQSIYHAVPVVYGGSHFLSGVVTRWRNQFHENSKSLAFSNMFPELNHNEIVGWETFPDVAKHFRVIFLRDVEESSRVKKRIEITKEILKERNVLFGEIFSQGESRLARIFSLIYVGDWASYYLAMLNEKDPINIDSIDLLKNRLNEIPA